MLRTISIIATVIVVLLGAKYLYSWYDLEFGEGARYREQYNREQMAQYEQERALKSAIWTNCSDIIRSKADVATLQIEWDAPSGESRREKGWRADLRASDSTGSIQVSCYTDDAGRVIRMVVR